jgi:hypothetical protein
MTFRLLAAVALCVFAHGTSAQTRKLASRAAFAALDANALLDSALMTPLNVRERNDSLMLDMMESLDLSVGPLFRTRGTRIRRWDGFGSQAHPREGILIDGAQVRGLLQTVGSLKGMRGVAERQIAERAEWALRFIVAHEYAHMVQYSHFGRDTVEKRENGRVIECAADLIGGYQYQVFLVVKSQYDVVPDIAMDVATDFGYVIGAEDWLDGTSHPLPEQRRMCIATGMGAARGMMVMQAARRGQADSAVDPTVKWLADNEPDLKSGKLSFMDWSMTRARGILQGGGAVASGSSADDVVRDTSVARLIGILGQLAQQGSDSMMVLRAGPAPTASGRVFLLRASLPPPWQCTIARARSGETATCGRDWRTGLEFARAQFDTLVSHFRDLLKNTPWIETKSEADESAPRQLHANVASAHFTLRGGDPDDERTPRIEVFLGSALEQTAAQLPPGFTLGFSVRAGRR